MQYELQYLKSALDHHEKQLIYLVGNDMVKKFENNSNQIHPQKKSRNYNLLMFRKKLSNAKINLKPKKSAFDASDLSNIDSNLLN